MSKRFITYDQLCVEIEAKHDLTVEQRRDVLKFARDFRSQLQIAARELAPNNVKSHINIKVT